MKAQQAYQFNVLRLSSLRGSLHGEQPHSPKRGLRIELGRLVYPSVYPKNCDVKENEDWCG